MWTIAHTKLDGTVATENLYEKKQTAELAANWRSKKRGENWYPLEIEEPNGNI